MTEVSNWRETQIFIGGEKKGRRERGVKKKKKKERKKNRNGSLFLYGIASKDRLGGSQFLRESDFKDDSIPRRRSSIRCRIRTQPQLA